MQYQSNPYLIWQLIPTIVTLGLALYIESRPKKKRESNSFSLLMFGGAIWSFANAVQWSSPDLEWQLRWNSVLYIGIVLVPSAWFIFAVKFTGIGYEQVEKRSIWFWFVPVLTYIAILSNEYHQLFFSSQKMQFVGGFASLTSEYGPLFFFHTAYSYLLLFSGMVILGYSLFTNFKKYGIHAYGLIIGVLTPLVGNIYFLFGPIPPGFPDPTPFLFSITGIAFAWTIFSSRMLEVIDLAHDSIVQNLSNGIVVLDLDHNILDINHSAIQILGLSTQKYTGQPFLQLFKNKQGLHETLITGLDRIKSGDANIIVPLVEKQIGYEVVFSNIQDKFGLITGRILEIWDVSDKIRIEERLAATRAAYESTMDTLKDSYFEADLTGIITYANKALVTNLGFNDVQDVVGKHFRYFIHRKSIRDVFENFRKLYETRQPIKSFEYIYTRKDGEERIAEIAVSPIIVGDEIIGSRGLIRDITARVKAEGALRETTQILGERVKELNCLYGISALVETPEITLDDILQGTVSLIPPAWQYSDITCARIILGEQEFITKNYTDSAWKMSADIIVNGMKRGVVEVHYLDEMLDVDDGEGPFLKEERNLINAIAERLGQITERQHQADRMAVLYQVGLATSSSFDMDAILVMIYEQCRQVLNANVFFVALYDGKKDEINYPIFFDKGKMLESFSVPLDTGLGGWIIRNQLPYQNNDLVANAEQLPIKMKRMGGEQTRSFIGAPLIGREGAIGAIAIQSYRAGVYNDADVQLLTTIAAQAAAAIENAQLYEAEQAAKERLESQNTEIKEQKDLLDGLLQHSPLSIVLNDLESKITVVNPAFEKLFGYSHEEAIGKNLDDILSTPEIVEEMNELTALGMSEQVFVVGQRKRKDGLLVDVEMFAAPLSVRGEKFGYLAFYNDISERIKTEADLEKTQTTFGTILDTLQDPYFEADKSGKITFVNNAYWKNMGYSGKEDVLGRNFRHFTDRKTVRQVFERFQKLYETKKPIEPFNYQYRKNDGSIQTAEIVVSPVFEAAEVVGSRGIIRDISVRIKAEEVLRQAKEAAEYRAGELAAINRISEAVSRSLDLVDILQSVCVELTTTFEIRNAGIGLHDVNKNILEIIAFYAIDPKEESAIGMVLPIEGNTSTQEVLNTKRTVVVQDAQSDPSTKSVQDLSKERGTKAIMIVPLLARGEAIGTIGMPAKHPNHIFTENEIELAETIASQIAAAIDNAQLHAKTESALDVAERDLEIGRQIQSGFFPEFLPEIPDWEITTHFQAARQVAGDFYDIFQFKNSNFTAFIIADVCDKGVGAALFMVLFRSLLRAFSEREVEIDNVQDQLLDIVVSTNKFISNTHGKSNMFATMFVGILDPDSGTLSYVNGGHDPPIVLDKTGNIIQKLSPTGPAVGLFPHLEFSVEEIKLNKGDILFGFTDGTTDARDPSGNFFTEEKLLRTLSAPWPSAFSMLYDLNSAVQEHIGGQDQYDDITQFSLRRRIATDDNFHAVTRKAVFENLGEFRDFAEAAAINCDLSHEHAFAFKLATEEICNNILQYGYEGQEPGNIGLSFKCENEKAILTITDDGKYFSPDQAEAPDIEADWSERRTGGLGIYFVKELMDNVSYNKIDDNKNMLVLEKELK